MYRECSVRLFFFINTSQSEAIFNNITPTVHSLDNHRSTSTIDITQHSHTYQRDNKSTSNTQNGPRTPPHRRCRLLLCPQEQGQQGQKSRIHERRALHEQRWFHLVSTELPRVASVYTSRNEHKPTSYGRLQETGATTDVEICAD